MMLLRAVVTGAGLAAIWELAALAFDLPHYILPRPSQVAAAWIENAPLILRHAGTTLLEMLLGLAFGALLGAASALAIAHFRPLRRWLLPVLVASQAVPVFALAPILVLWLGYGLASKVAMATIIIYFPVAAAFLDGLRRTDRGWLDLAQVMGASPAAVLRHIRTPAALPALGSGLRVAAAVAPIGAVIGEWVGSSAGLGYLMLQANARLRIDLMFAALLTLAVAAIALYYVTDAVVRRALPWRPDTLTTDDME
jgi:putative hydroxymethylpyrimidine transport system permease protein